MDDPFTGLLILAAMLRYGYSILAKNPSAAASAQTQLSKAASTAVKSFNQSSEQAVSSAVPTAVRQYASKSSYSPDDLVLPSKSHFGFKIVPQQVAMIVERFGRYTETLPPGFHFLIPVFDRIAYVHTLKEVAMEVPNQAAITQDNVTINIDGVLYVKVVNPVEASYGVQNPMFAIRQLAMTTMRSELGKMTLDQTFADREALNAKIVHAINSASSSWGVTCLRYEIRDIIPPDSVLRAMELQLAAERKKRAQILESEGTQLSQINIAEGNKRAHILEAEGEAGALIEKARATARSIQIVGDAIAENGGRDAVSFKLAEKYVDAFGQMAQQSNTVVVPSDVTNASSMVANGLAVFNAISKRVGHSQASSDDSKQKATNAAADDTFEPVTDRK